MEKKFIWFIISAILAFIIVFTAYFSHFNNGFSILKSDWGTFGDYIGGTLNPILSFLSLIAILYTITQQNHALKISQEELENTREELRQSKEISKRQVEHFEFQAKKEDLIRAIELAKSNIHIQNLTSPSPTYTSVNSITKSEYNSVKIFYLYLKSYDDLVGEYNSLTDYYKNLYFVIFKTFDTCGFSLTDVNPQADEYIAMKNYFQSGSRNFNLLDTRTNNKP
jgi:uncharacterized membrane protein